MSAHNSEIRFSATSRASKYLKYAFGEIILVVIGIIIALQLNNWNENQKKLKLKNTYLKALIADYSNDTSNLKQIIQENSAQLEQLSELRAFIATSAASSEDYTYLFENFIPDTNFNFEYNTNTYDVIIATGNIDLFDTETIQMIIELKKSQDMAIKTMEKLDGMYRDQLTEMTQDYPIYSTYENMSEETKKLLWQSVDLNKLPLVTDGITGLKHYNLRGFLYLNEDVLLKTENLLNHLKGLNK